MTTEGSSVIKLEMATPERGLPEMECSSVLVPGVDGFFLVLPGHAPLLSLLDIGVLEVETADGEKHPYFVNGGYVEVLGNKVVVLSQDISPGREIELNRAEEARNRATTRLKQRDGVDVARAEHALRRALARIQAQTRLSPPSGHA